MAGIIEPDAAAAVLGRPGVQRQRLGALHVRIEATEPEQPGGRAFAGAYRDSAPVIAFADLDEIRFRIG